MEETVKKAWARATKEEKSHAKYIGRRATRFRGRKAKEKAAELRMARKSAIRNEKRTLGRRLSSEEMTGLMERLHPALVSV